MPRSVIVLGAGADLFDDVRRSLRTDGRFIDGGDVIHCDGVAAPLTNIYAADLSPAEWEDIDAPDGMPDPLSMSTLILECRSPEWVAEIGQLLAQSLDQAVWIVDCADMVWPAGRIEYEQVTLT